MRFELKQSNLNNKGENISQFMREDENIQ